MWIIQNGAEGLGQTCLNCRFGHFMRENAQRPWEYQHCRRRSPTWAINQGSHGMSEFPNVTEYDWCGEWEAATKGEA